MDFLRSDKDLQELVSSFEKGTLQEGQWHHAEHVAVCYWYLCNKTYLETIYRLKLGILKYNEQYSIAQTEQRGYHETITLFFVKFVQKYLEKHSSDPKNLVAGLKRLLESTPFLPLLWKHYSRPHLNSVQARTEWVEPDLEKL